MTISGQKGVDTCTHRNVVVDETECDLVCSACGVLLDANVVYYGLGDGDGDDSVQTKNGGMTVAKGAIRLTDEAKSVATTAADDARTACKSRANLFEAVSLGSRNDLPDTEQNKMLRMYMRGNIKDRKSKKQALLLSRFSNTCEKLELDGMLSKYAWGVFTKAIGRKSARKTAEVAGWAIYQTCKTHGVSVVSHDIVAAVASNFGRKQLPSMMKILYENMDCAEDCVVSDAACTDKEAEKNTKTYYFTLNLKTMLRGRRYNTDEFATAKRQAWYLFSKVFTQGDYNTRTRRSIAAAFGV